MASRRWWRELVLTVGALLGVVCLIVSVAAVAFGMHALVFRSGSMAPTIDTGALALAKTVDAADLKVGDIVSVKDTDGTRVTHRIVDLEQQADRATLTLKGDDNKAVDAEPYNVTSVERVLFDVPKLGYVVSWLSGPVGLFLLGIYAAFLLSVLFSRGDRPRKRARGARRAATGAVAVALVASTALGAGSTVAEATWAAWNDQASASGGSFQAHYLRPVESMTCTTGPSLLGLFGGHVTFGVKHRDARYDYRLRVYDSAGVQRGPDIEVPSGSTAVGAIINKEVTASQIKGLLSLGQSATVRVYSVLKASPAWASESFRAWRLQTSLLNLGLLGLLDGVRCDTDVTGAADTAGPTIAFTAPTNGVNADAGTYRDNVVRPACGNGRPGCGTVSDPSGVASVSYQLKRARSNGTEYFHASSGAGGIWTSNADFESAGVGSGRWEFDGLLTTAYFDWNENMLFTLTIKAVDNFGNESTASINFILH